MKFFRLALLSYFFSALSCSLVFASPATASNAMYDEVLEEMEEGGALSDFDYEQFFFDLFASFADGPSHDVEEEMEMEMEEEPVMVEAALDMLDMPMAFSASPVLDTPDVNCVWYHVLISGQEYDLCFPKEDADMLWVSDSGYLYNVGNKDVIGRVFDGDVIPPTRAYKLVQLGSILRDNMNNLRSYGSYAMLQDFYFDSAGRKKYDLRFVHIQVLDVTNTYHTSNYLMYVIVFLLGGVLLCLLKKSSR